MRICHQLEGIPLAIELAVVRLKVLTPAQLSGRLSGRLQLLTEGPSTFPARQQTLRATMDGTYELCSPDEQRLWRHGAVFAGGFTLDSIEQVCGELAPDLLRTVSGLLDKSVLSRVEEAGTVRFRMLATIREYGLDRLARTGGLAQVQTGFVRWAEGLVAAFEREWFGPRADDAFARLRAEHTNLRTALDLCLDGAGDPSTALRMARPWAYWVVVSLSEGRHWLRRALDRSGGDPGARASALVSYAYVTALQGDQEQARSALDDAETLAPAASADHAAHLRGLTWFFDGDLGRARALLADAERGYRRRPVPDGWVVSLHIHTGLTLLFDGDAAGAEAHFRSALAICHRADECWMTSYALFGLAFVEHDRGVHAAARRLLVESMRTKRDVGDVLGTALALELHAWILAADGSPAAARQATVVLAGAGRLWNTFGRELYGSSDWIRRRTRCEARCRELLGDQAYEAAHAHGATLGREETIAAALEGADPRTGTVPDAADPRSSPAGTDPLTARERQVAALVARGLSNRDIARELTLSVRTVEGHVQRVLTKLAFTSRTQIAAWVAAGADRAAP